MSMNTSIGPGLSRFLARRYPEEAGTASPDQASDRPEPLPGQNGGIAPETIPIDIPHRFPYFLAGNFSEKRRET
jgi:hypothetical protein